MQLIAAAMLLVRPIYIYIYIIYTSWKVTQPLKQNFTKRHSLADSTDHDNRQITRALHHLYHYMDTTSIIILVLRRRAVDRGQSSREIVYKTQFVRKSSQSRKVTIVPNG